MQKVAWILVSGALVAACGSPPNRNDTGVSPDDASTDDASTVITIADSGGGHDAAGGGHDAAVGEGDAGSATTSCGVWEGVTGSMIFPLPASCLPRCSSATRGAIGACPENDGGACAYGALAADTTPTVEISTPTTVATLNCETCFVVQQFHCASLSCPAEAGPAYVCNPETDDDACDGEHAALNACLEGLSESDRMASGTCLNTNAGACFDAGDGFFGGGQELPNLDIETLQRFSETVAH